MGFTVFKVGFFVIFEDRHFKFDQKDAFFWFRNRSEIVIFVIFGIIDTLNLKK